MSLFEMNSALLSKWGLMFASNSELCDWKVQALIGHDLEINTQRINVICQ